jgi:hypothetical protein
MRLMLAIKVFFKALREPQKALKFLKDQPKEGRAKGAEIAASSHLRLLALLQHSGRLIDFFKEDVAGFSDAQIGAAVRKIHQDCGKSLEELVTIRPIMDENEGTVVSVAAGYDPSQIKVIGKVKGEPPFSGIVVHRGWKAYKKSLPKKIGEQPCELLYPAEVEVR